MIAFAARRNPNILINFTISLVSHNLLFVLIDKLFLDIRNNNKILIFIFYAKNILISISVLLRRDFNSCHLINFKSFLFSLDVFRNFLWFGLLLLFRLRV